MSVGSKLATVLIQRGMLALLEASVCLSVNQVTGVISRWCFPLPSASECEWKRHHCASQSGSCC